MKYTSQIIDNIKDYYNIELSRLIEDDREISKVEFYKNENKYSLDSNGNIIKMNLKDNAISDLEGLLEASNTLTHLNLSGNKLNKINLINNFKKLKHLDLGSNEIKDITGLKNLGNLEYLYLDNNQITIIPNLDLFNLIEFWAYSNRIKDISNIKYLTSIKSLNISDNQISNISYLSKLTKLENFNVNKNKIHDISTLKNLKSFESLDLSHNQITDITALKNISVNTDLMIGQNQIIDLTPLYQALKRKKINFINAFENPLIYPPLAIVMKGEISITEWFDNIINTTKEKIIENKQSNSRILDIGRMGLTDLSLIPELFQMHDLKELIISNEWAEYNEVEKRWIRRESQNKGLKNNIFNIPSDIAKLQNLEKLVVSGDWKSKHSSKSNNWRIIDVSSLFKLKKLQFLNISNNEIQDISEVTNLQHLEIAHINNNKIDKAPPLVELKNLKEIYLSNNLIESIDFLKDCLQLVTVDLHSNRISNLIPLENLLLNSTTGIKIRNSSWEKKVISISKNSPNIVPPYEILEQSNEGFFLYLRQLKYEGMLELESYYNKEIKIILIGNSNSGKSTLLNYLKTKRFKKNIPITHWLVTEELLNVKINNETLKLRFFDFGGQDYYHDTHKIFFSSDSVYLLLWDNNSNHLGEIEDKRVKPSIKTQVFPLEYWLDSIKIYAKKSLTESQKQMEQLLDERDVKINSKIKDPTKGNWTVDVLDATDSIGRIANNRNVLIIQNKIEISQGYLNQFKLVNDYPNIYDFANLSLLESKGKKQFEENYLDIIKKNSNYNRPLLATWGYVKDNWDKIFKSDDFIIDMSIFREKINSFISIWLKNKFNKSENEISNILFEDEEIVLFAKFLKEIGLVIYHSQKENYQGSIIVNQNNFLTEVYKILEISKKHNGKINLNELNEINHKDEVIRTLVNHKILFKGLKDSNYIAPLFLQEKPDLLIDLLADIKTPFRRFRFNGFIPKSIILSIFSEVFNKQNVSNEGFYYWKNGLIFKDKKTKQKVFIKFNIDYKYKCAYIDVFNFKSNVGDDFIKTFIIIIKAVIEIEGVQINELLTLDGIYFIELKNLKFNYENKINYITAKDFLNEESVQISVYNFNNLLEDSMKKPTKKLFISYSKQDEELVNNFIEHLSTLQSSGIIESWYCTELKGGDDWDLTIKEKLDEADIVCFMISPKFMSTPYIHKYEVKHTFKRYERDGKVKIIPIILDYIDWSRKYNFKSESGEELAWPLDKFTALPFIGKEVMEFKNQNKAWYLIANIIKIIIEDDINSEKDEDEIVRKFPPKIKKLYEDIIKDNI
ncbi:leucine-rich repeat domain-containing protein [Mesonia ostreae]|uniref:Leucine-rich repeat domain-containing protein n=1 Tax=Mesonia ostreae TaxID=861110 RepID=A0ABU2KJQ1_9FLAO|nr:leucine-rich repeat domain-containing protein [Mesonia ostreae]MDT0294904.1 leucine-rich repeat domain-containing protein [Mesonia ostreae]